MTNPNVSGIVGALFIGLTISLYAYGLATVYTCYYFLHYSADRLWLKLRVGVLWVLCTVFVILQAWTFYRDIVLCSHRHDASLVVQWSGTLNAAFMVNLCMVALVQLHFMMKIHKLNSRPWQLPITLLLGCTIIIRFAFGIVAMQTLGLEFTSTVPSNIFDKSVIDRSSLFRRVVVIIFLCTTVISDVMITVFLCILFRPGDVISKPTHYLVLRLTMFALRRCVAVSILAIAELAAVLSHSPEGTQASFFNLEATVGGVYVINLLVNLNARRHLNPQSYETPDINDGGEMNINWAGPDQVLPISLRDNEARNPLPSSTYGKSKLAWYEILWGGW